VGLSWPDETRSWACRGPRVSPTFAVHGVKDGKKRKNTRGASGTHPSLDRAKVAMERLAATAVKAGWVKKERAGGFARKPDAFDAAHLPAPGKKGGR
jgi:hypothetical protein